LSELINKEFLKQAPFLRLVFPLIAGITLRILFSIPLMIVVWLLSITFLSAFCCTVYKRFSRSFKYRWAYGLSMSLAICCAGILLTDNKLKSVEGSLQESQVPVGLVGIVNEPPDEKAKSEQCIVNIYSTRQKGNAFKHDKILLYFHKDSASKALKAGDIIFFKSVLAKIEISGNPYEFDYSKFLSRKGIRLSGYVDEKSWKLLGSNGLSVFQRWAYAARDKLLAFFSHIGMTGDELGVASALIIGDQGNLDNDIKRAYVASGTMHILAVSGMHVALLYWVLNMLLSFLDKVAYGKYLKLVLLLLAVWLYALITGMGGSILRAAVMITFVIIGQSFARKVNIFNSLAASAFFLLVINPFNIIDVGFQLSYLAVIGIVVLYPMIYGLFDIKNWLGDQLWSLMSVTLAAQIAATPISLLYFHQFPNLFIISNIIMVPLSTLIMYVAMVLILSSGWNWLAGFLGKVFNFLVWLLNQVVIFIEGLPYALTKGIYMLWYDACLLYILICFITLFLIRKQTIYFVFALGSVLVLAFHGLLNQYQRATTKEVIVYHDTKNSIIQFHDGYKSVWLVGENNERVSRFVERAREAMQSKENKLFIIDSLQRQTLAKGRWVTNHLWIREGFVQFFDKKMFINDLKITRRSSNSYINVDYMLIRNVQRIGRDTAFFRYPARSVIIDASSTNYYAGKIEKYLSGTGTNVYNVLKSGAFRGKIE
jgi:competence protein ComEC